MSPHVRIFSWTFLHSSKTSNMTFAAGDRDGPDDGPAGDSDDAGSAGDADDASSTADDGLAVDDDSSASILDLERAARC